MRAAEIRLKHLIRVPRYAIAEAVRLLPLTACGASSSRTQQGRSVGTQLVEKFQWRPTEPFPLLRLTLESLAILRPQGFPLARVLACVKEKLYADDRKHNGRACVHAGGAGGPRPHIYPDPILVSWYSGGKLGNYGDPAVARSVFVDARLPRAKARQLSSTGLKPRSPAQPNRRKLGIDDIRAV